LFDSKKIADRALQRAGEIKTQDKNRRTKIKAVTTLFACVVCMGVFISVMLPGTPQDDNDCAFLYLDDISVPLASFHAFAPSEPSVVIPTVSALTVPANQCYAEIDVINPEENDLYVIFEVVLDATGDVLFTSEKIAPGMPIGNVALLRPLQEGVYAATLTIRPHGSDTGGALEDISVALQVTAK
jgi:hypothetical protein